MSARPSFQRYPGLGFAFVAGSPRAAPVERTPRQNRLLASLPIEDYERLLPHLEPVALSRASVLHDAGDREGCLYFPTAGLVSRVCVTQSGAAAEFAITGREGVIGLASFLGGQSTPSQAIVLRAGHAYRLRANLLTDELGRGGPLARLLLCYVQALIAQIGQVAACNRHHSLEQRLCRWMLACLDRSAASELVMTQDLIARLLGVRRQGVTHAAGKLQEAGAIRYSRGRIAVLDRSLLEARACECYAVVKREYDRLLPERERPEAA